MKTRSIVLAFALPITLFPASAQEDCNDLVPSVLGYNPLDGGIIDVMGRADRLALGFHWSFALPLLCYLYLAWYGFKGSRHARA